MTPGDAALEQQRHGGERLEVAARRDVGEALEPLVARVQQDRRAPSRAAVGHRRVGVERQHASGARLRHPEAVLDRAARRRARRPSTRARRAGRRHARRGRSTSATSSSVSAAESCSVTACRRAVRSSRRSRRLARWRSVVSTTAQTTPSTRPSTTTGAYEPRNARPPSPRISTSRIGHAGARAPRRTLGARRRRRRDLVIVRPRCSSIGGR